MRHSPIQATDENGKPKLILPFAKSWINAEEEYAQSQRAEDAAQKGAISVPLSEQKLSFE